MRISDRISFSAWAKLSATVCVRPWPMVRVTVRYVQFQDMVRSMRLLGLFLEFIVGDRDSSRVWFSTKANSRANGVVGPGIGKRLGLQSGSELCQCYNLCYVQF